MQSRIFFSLVATCLMTQVISAAKPVSPGIATLGIHADLHEFADGGSAVKVLKVIPDSPAQRLYDPTKTPANDEPYEFYTLEKDDLIVGAWVNTVAGVGPPMWSASEIKNIKDLKLLLHSNLGKLIQLKVKTPGEKADEYTELKLQVKVAELPVQ